MVTITSRNEGKHNTGVAVLLVAFREHKITDEQLARGSAQVALASVNLESGFARAPSRITFIGEQSADLSGKLEGLGIEQGIAARAASAIVAGFSASPAMATV